jgi:hypothetical protein
MFNKGIVRVSTRAEYETLVTQYIAWRAQFLDEEGQLQKKYSPAPHALNFRDEEGDAPAVTKREAIPVPAGPNELW